jgi:hypothetical protein
LGHVLCGIPGRGSEPERGNAPFQSPGRETHFHFRLGIGSI